MPAEIGATAIPHRLCQWCEYVVKQLRPSFPASLEHDRLLFHYPNMQAFIGSILQQNCHLCAIFAGWLVGSFEVCGIEEALEKLDKYRNKADSPLLMVMKNSPPDSDDAWQAFNLFVGYDIDGRTLETVARAYVKHFNEGTIKMDVTPDLLSTFTGSDQSYANIKSWLHTCSTEHEGCRSNLRRRAPTRLLDLEHWKSKDVKLVAGSTVGQAPYVALSYCWGSVPQLMLLPNNKLEFQRRISFESLSKVAQDATAVCRAMSVRYLWIDAMCIIQGPSGDFQQEAARMEDVYANALFTITAAASTNTTQPFLVPRDPLWWTDCHLIENESEEYQTYIEGNPYCEAGENVPGSFALDSRGWCFQEQFLSPRSIYFGSKGVHWECRESVVCERLQDTKLDHYKGTPDVSRKTLYMELMSLGDDLSDPATTYKLREIWDKIIHRYTETRLTHRSDRLVALAGVASMIESKFKMRASFGLWLGMFPDELLWSSFAGRGNGEPRGVRHDIAPSWSWVSLEDCGIIGANTLHTGEMGEEHQLLNFCSVTIISLPHITGFTTPLWAPSAGNEAPIRLKGRLTTCVQRTEKSKFRDQLIYRLDPKDRASEFDKKQGEYYPDTASEETDLHCFLVRREYRKFLDNYNAAKRGACVIWDHCLVLTPVFGSNHRFRRTGFYTEVSEAFQKHENATDMSNPTIYLHMFAGEGEEQEIEII